VKTALNALLCPAYLFLRMDGFLEPVSAISMVPMLSILCYVLLASTAS
jgi:hypothetical protein